MIRAEELEKLESLLVSKAFDELTPKEKIWVSQWIESEIEYTHLRKVEGAIKKHLAASTMNTPDPKVLKNLKAQLKARTSSQVSWWQVRTPGWSTLLVAISFGVTGWLIGRAPAEQKTEQAYFPARVYDTVYLTSKPDTVFIKQVVYKDRPLLLQVTRQVENLSSENSAKGINMKEKEELENLLVSGSR